MFVKKKAHSLKNVHLDNSVNAQVRSSIEKTHWMTHRNSQHGESISPQ